MSEIDKMRSDLEHLQQRIGSRQQHYITEGDPVIARMVGRKVELESAIGLIEQLQAEAVRLKAVLQQFMALNQHDRDLPLELFAIQRSVSAEAVSLAAHDADVIEQLLSNMFHHKGMTASHYKCAELVEWMQDYANQLRQQAKEQSHES